MKTLNGALQRRSIGTLGFTVSLWAHLCLPSAWAGGEPTVTTTEINQLMHFIRASGCEFKRNSTWHTPAQAVELLQKKRDYMLMWGKIPNTEYFIDEAATRSSTSGDAYHVRCQGTQQQESRLWLSEELTRFRKTKH